MGCFDLIVNDLGRLQEDSAVGKDRHGVGGGCFLLALRISRANQFISAIAMLNAPVSHRCTGPISACGHAP